MVTGAFAVLLSFSRGYVAGSCIKPARNLLAIEFIQRIQDKSRRRYALQKVGT